MINSGYVMGVVQNHFYNVVEVITLRKNIYKKTNLLWNSGHLDRQNDVKLNNVPLSYSADIDDFAMTYGNFIAKNGNTKKVVIARWSTK